jgi:hypothetical protein
MKPMIVHASHVLSLQVDENAIVLNICGNGGHWEFTGIPTLSTRWTKPETSYRDWIAKKPDTDDYLGRVKFVQVEPTIVVANLIGQHCHVSKRLGKTYINEYAHENMLRIGLKKVADRAVKLGASVHVPVMGLGRAVGNWDRHEPSFLAAFCDRDIQLHAYTRSA